MIFWYIYCILEGMNDAFMYNIRDYNKVNPINEHKIKLLQRFIIVLCISYCFGWYSFFICALTQPFLHNNSYYNTRHYLDKDIYKYGLFSQSFNSTARMTKYETPRARIILFTIGILINFLYFKNIL